MNKAIFLDRDGVINHDFGYVYKISDFRLIDGVTDALKFFQLKEYLLIIVTNQSGIGRGFFTEQEFQEINSHMLKIFKNDSININSIYYCPHHPNDNCKCRKPKNYLIEKAIKEYKIDRKISYFIGDKYSDMLASQKSKLKKFFLVNSHLDNDESFETFNDLNEVASKWDQIK
tara:strand:- start:1113 stop:1631 length:519 start_codon:yes stop_codon:yes gene_type:complete